VSHTGLGMLGNDFYATIENLIDCNSREDYTDISYNELKELIEDTQYQNNLEENNRIAKIITTRLPIFSLNKETNKFSISEQFKTHCPRFSSISFHRKENFFKFCCKSTVNAQGFKDYCNAIYLCSTNIKTTTFGKVPKSMVKFLEKELGHTRKSTRKLLQDLGVIIKIEKGEIICDLVKYRFNIDDLDFALKIIKDNVDLKYKVLDRRFAYKILENFKFYSPKEILEQLQDKEKILIRGTRSGFYLDFN